MSIHFRVLDNHHLKPMLKIETLHRAHGGEIPSANLRAKLETFQEKKSIETETLQCQ